MVMEGKEMLRRLLTFICFIIVCSNCLAFNALFPNEILYQSRPSSGIRYQNKQVDFFLNTKFPVDTIFKYKVSDPIIAGLIQTESSFFLHAISDSNAIGPYQMKPFIASEIGVLNPFNPYNDKKVSTLIDGYKQAFGNVDYALGAYHIGFYGFQKILDSGNDPMNDNRVNSYVQKNRSFQRLFKEGDKIPIKDYIWFDMAMSISEVNRFSVHVIIPEFFLGSIALGMTKKEAFNFSLYQDFSLFWFLNAYIGYDDGLIVGLTLKSNDWYDQVSIKYDFSKDDLIWVASSSFEHFSLGLGFSKTSVFIKPAFILNGKYSLEVPLYYSDHTFKPGISVIIKF